jgi:bifunctional lysine-specific demethylase and histidyl-hydroxylase NO66
MADQVRDVAAELASEDPLSFIVAPVPPDTFLSRHYGRSPLLCTSVDRDRFAHLLTPQELDRFIDTADLREDMVTLARSGRVVERWHYVSPSGRVIPSALAEHYLNGGTIILQHLHDSIGRLGALCRALELRLSVHAQTNIYLTPAGAQGFAPHADTHDVFVLQIAGRKRWRLRTGAEAETLTLAPGDCLYIPRGIVHDAASDEDGPSLHITLGLIANSWADLLAAAVAELAETEPMLGEALPPGHARPEFDPRALEPGLQRLAGSLDVPLLVSAALTRLAHDYLRDRRPQVAGVLASSFHPGSARRYRARATIQWRLREGARELILIGPGGDLRFDLADSEALRLALSGQTFIPAALPAPDPHRLFRLLWANGYIEPLAAD